jgi:hypothetical protein
VTASKVVNTNDIETFGVDDLAGTNKVFPPARLAVFQAVVTCEMMCTTQRVANKYRIITCGI